MFYGLYSINDKDGFVNFEDSDLITIEVTAPNGDLAFAEAQVSVTDQLYGTPISDDDNRLVSYLQKESKAKRWISDGIAGIFFSVLFFIFYFISTSNPSVSLSDREVLFIELLPWGGALSLLVGICCVIYGTRYIKRCAESFKKK